MGALVSPTLRDEGRPTVALAFSGTDSTADQAAKRLFSHILGARRVGDTFMLEENTSWPGLLLSRNALWEKWPIEAATCLEAKGMQQPGGQCGPSEGGPSQWENVGQHSWWLWAHPTLLHCGSQEVLWDTEEGSTVRQSSRRGAGSLLTWKQGVL